MQASADTARRVYWLRCNPANTGNVFIGNDTAGDVASTNGLTLAKADPPIQVELRLNDLYVDAANNGDKLDVMCVLD